MRRLSENVDSNFAVVEQLAQQAKGRGLLVGIDGPSGVGKSTISRRVAQDLGLGFLETGAMYRALTWVCLKDGVDVEDAIAVADRARDLGFSSRGSIESPKFFVGDTDVTEALRSDEVAGSVSTVSSHPAVREQMVQAQRQQMLDAREEGKGMVAEGRDITTVVCPDADVLVLLQADPEVRLTRRVRETYGEVTPEKMEEMAHLIHGRDEKDAAVTQFQTAAAGVTTIDSTDMSIDEVTDRVFQLAQESLSGGD